jgi:serine/threonine protein kinase
VSDSPTGRWQRIERLYNDAIARDPVQREAFLAEACGDDEELRQEVGSLLGYDSAAAQFLERPALAEAARSLAREARPALTGRRISGYDVLALLGAGGMGEVYRARDRRLGRDVALKVVEPSLAADPEYAKRFEHEAQSASALNHPNIVTIYSVSEQDDVTFITMELVQGQTLRRFMAAAMPLRTALDNAVQRASALTAAHASGIVHHDLKPENVMVTPDGFVKVSTSASPSASARRPMAARRSARSATCRQNRRWASLQVQPRISSPSAQFCTKCWQASTRFSGHPQSRRWRRLSARSPARSRH